MKRFHSRGTCVPRCFTTIPADCHVIAFAWVWQYCAHQAGAVFDFLVDPLEQVGGPDLFPVLVWEVPDGEHGFPGLKHEVCRLRNDMGREPAVSSLRP